MSRTISRGLHRLVRLAMAPQGAGRRAMTRARLITLLEQDGSEVVTTRHGTLRFLASRGPHLAAAVAKFASEEPEMLAWIDGFAGGETFWDIGAAAGLFSLYAALIPGVTVFAFEPKATSFGVLVEHLALNGMGDRITTLPVAFGDHAGLGFLDLATLAPGSGGNSLDGAADQFGNRHAGFRQGTIAYRIDEFRAAFGLGVPDHVKIDVDGVEAAILRGAAETLRDVRSVMVEVEGENARDAADRIDAPLAAAGLHEVISVRGSGSGRNRLYRRD